MKVMTYNILCGGLPHVNGTDRRKDILRLAEEHAPDVLALQEANGFDEEGVLETYSKALSLPHYALSRGALYEGHERYHVVIFSRYPISHIHEFAEGTFQSAALSVRLESPLGQFSLCAAHLHAYSETERIEELDYILAYQDKFEDQLILGDLNAISRSDGYAADDSEFELKYEVTDQLNQKLVDVFAKTPETKVPTFPSKIASDNTCKLPRRIDYMFASQSLSERVASARVVTSDLARRCSDHFPLIAGFE